MQYRNDDGRAVLDGIRRIVRVLRESSAKAKKAVGLSGAQLFVLQNLAAKGGMSVNELAARTLTHQSTVSVVASKLVARGLVTKSASRDDARRVDLALTPKGRVLLSRAPGAAQDRLIDGVRKLGSSERRQLALTLTRLASAVEATPREPVMFFEEDEPLPTRKRRKS